FHVFDVNVASGKVRELTPFPGARATPIGVDRHFPNDLLVGLNKDNPRVFDVYRIDLTSGEAKLDTKNPGDVMGWTTDANFRIRAAQAPTPDGGTQIRVRADEKSDWKPLVTWGPDDSDGSVVTFSKDGKSVVLESSEKRDTLAVVRRDLADGSETVIAQHPGSDAGAVVVNPETKEIEAVSFNHLKTEWKA